MSFRNLEGQLARWLEQIQQYNSKLFIGKKVYIPMRMACTDDLE